MICYWFPEPTYFFFAEGVPELLYYSHFPTTIIALLLGLFVYFNARHLLPNKLLFLISIFFSIWTLTSLILWTQIDSAFLAFIWTVHVSLFGFIAIYSVYFIYAFLSKEDVSWKIKSIFALLLAPLLIFGPTDLNISGFDIGNCDAFIYEGQLYKFYYIALAVISMVWILGLLIKYYRKSTAEFKKQIVYMGFGIEFFLFTFFSLVILASYLTEFGFFQDSRLELYGLFGMTIFMIILGILIVRFKSFNIGMLAAQALVGALVVLVGSQFTYATSTLSIVLTSITLILTGLAGVILIRSVRKEVEQKEKLEVLTQKLAVANERLKELDKLKSEFVSIASHQLRSPLTAIRGYASLISDGSYGKVPQKAMEAIERISESAKNMAYSIEDYLNVSRIESGNMKYNNADFNLKDEAEKVSDDLRPQAIKKGLTLLFRTDLKSKGIINADQGKVIQIIQNLVNNSIKYTPEGSIKMLVRDDVTRKKIYIDIEDTGVGIPPESIDNLFGKFERATNANSANIHGTGLGLFVAHKMAVQMGGDIHVKSEGEGKGSLFTIEFPLAM